MYILLLTNNLEFLKITISASIINSKNKQNV